MLLTECLILRHHKRTDRLNLSRVITPLILLLGGIGCNSTDHQQDSVYLQPDYWKKQTIDLLPVWTKHIVDEENGSYFTTLDAEWQAVDDTVRFPSMIARHLFGYSAAYLLNGDSINLTMAHRLKDYLLKYAWDQKHGGWYEGLDPKGQPVRMGKSTFVQLYAITGLTMYYFITRDAEILHYIDRSNQLLEEMVWDHEFGGYFDNPRGNWLLENDIKSFSSQLAPVSGYLLYLYMATRNEDYLAQAERIMDIVLAKMVDNRSGWILESFDREWKYLPGPEDENEINIGHNVEVAWMLMRIYMLNGRPDYLRAAQSLSDSLHRYGFNPERGIWYANVGNVMPEQHTDFTHWWIQAYGQMFDLCMARYYPEANYIEDFLAGSAFWESSFMDGMRGDTHLTVRANGEVVTPQKANQFKASYHSVEHGMLNYLYLAAWVNREPVTLHFRITACDEGDVLYALPIEVPGAALTKVKINGIDTAVPASGEGLQLPYLRNATIEVTVGAAEAVH